ncbi:MAG TPA: HD domain-containing protein [Lacipirellulaceae bacterium]|nr:HD domain-containing protein [Lacipirellulaceae bacterium]
MSEDRLPSASASLRATVDAVRGEAAAGRQRIRELHERGLDALQVCGRLTSLTDDLVLRLFDAAAAEEASGGAAARQNLALVALGGYGRRQMAPYSDVDLMLLRGETSVEQLTPLVRRFTNSMFDAGFQLGHSLRTAVEAVQLARGDAIICSSLIDCRLIGGSQGLFEEFRTQFARLISKRARAICRAFYASRDAERSQYGESLYLLEPHVKRSRGGLRDIHLLRWVGYVEHGESSPDALAMIGAMSKFEHHRLLGAQTFLLKLRNDMHFTAGNPRDLLERAEQLRVAETFGYRGNAGMLSVEQFMRDYFRHTNHVWQMVQRRQAALETEASAVSRVLDPVIGRTVEGDYRIGVRNIAATRSGLAKLPGRVEEVLRLVELSIRESKPLDRMTTSALVLAGPEASDERAPAPAGGCPVSLAPATAAGRARRFLHEWVPLEKITPPMKHARCLLQFNQYHKFTVDEHTLQALERAGEFAGREDALGEAYREISDKALLHLALLVHDLGKGFEEDHSEVGRRIAEEMGERLQLGERRMADLAFLVHRHLAMSHLAFRRDTGDEELVRAFAREMATPQRLRMLLVLTCADLAAVGPDVLTKWKVDVLIDLYRKALSMLEGTTPSAGAKLTQRRRQAVELLDPNEAADLWHQRQINALPDSVVSQHEPEAIVEMLRRLRRLPSRGAAAWGSYDAEDRTVEFVAGVDHGRGRGAFSSMAGALSSRGLQIMAAEAHVLADDLLLLRYLATDPDSEGAPPRGRLEEVAAELAAAVDAEQPPKFRRVWGQDAAEASRKLTSLPNDVRIHNNASSDATVIEVFTFDRTGLLYRLARRLHDLELTIWRAKIGTYIDQVVDVFYVTNRGGGKIEDDARIDHIRRELLAVIDASDS